ncbi:replication initiator protein [Salmonella enterica subsp. enterica serovar Anatum]|nr:replication initiator protein [Salmonella enterica subsp. enterica serovar Anatum]
MGSCAAPSAKGDDKFITTDYLQQCPSCRLTCANAHKSPFLSGTKTHANRVVTG